MKPISIISILFLSLLSSCQYFTKTSYIVHYETSKALDFRTEKYLVNNIETDLSWKMQEALNNDFVNKLKKIGGEAIVYIDDIRMKYSLPNKISFKPSKENFELLKLTTNFDYLVNVTTKQIRNDAGSIILTDPFSYKKNESEITIIIYDIKTSQEIYKQRVIAYIELDQTNKDVIFVNSSSNLIFKAVKKGLKEIKKYKIKF